MPAANVKGAKEKKKQINARKPTNQRDEYLLLQPSAAAAAAGYYYKMYLYSRAQR